MKTTLCHFSGYKIHPGHGFTFVRTDLRSFIFINAKNLSLFLKKKNPRVIRWTRIYRRINKKGVEESSKKKKTRKTVKVQKAIVGASLEVLKAKRVTRPHVKRSAAKVETKQAVEDIKKKKKETTKSKKQYETTQKSKAVGKFKSGGR